jgi:hypothetical protein
VPMEPPPFAPQAIPQPPGLSPEQQEMEQLLALNAHLGAGGPPSDQDAALQELALQKEVLSADLSTTKEKPWYTSGEEAWPRRSEYLLPPKKNNKGRSFARLKEAGCSDLGAGFLAEALERSQSLAQVNQVVEKLASMDTELCRVLAEDLEKVEEHLGPSLCRPAGERRLGTLLGGAKLAAEIVLWTPRKDGFWGCLDDCPEDRRLRAEM